MSTNLTGKQGILKRMNLNKHRWSTHRIIKDVYIVSIAFCKLFSTLQISYSLQKGILFSYVIT